MQHNLRMLQTKFFCVFYCSLSHITQQSLIGVLAGTAGHLQNHGRTGFDGCLNNGLQLLHIVEIKCSDSILTGYGLLEHLS
jgi:hypothetical protein